MFWIEMAFFIAPLVLLWGRRAMNDVKVLFQSAILMIIAGALYRFDTFLIAFQPGGHFSYFPSVGEITVTVGIVAMEILAYIVIIHYFPILSGAPRRAAVAEKAGV
jgi:Ni/Fe-hydrogenase subunit HybB-like protein